MTPNLKPLINWDMGTAYDLFASLHVLHHPEKFGLRGSWAAGVRSRLTTPQRATLEESQILFFSSPIAWVSSLPEPKDAAAVLWTLGQIEPAQRLPTLAFHNDVSPKLVEILKEVSTRRSWNESDLAHFQSNFQQKEGAPTSEEMVTAVIRWSHPEEFGERYLAALQAYVAVFFAEEERRIRPYLQQALTRGQELAMQLNFPQLMVELSQGVKIVAFEEADEVMFVPSYWSTPLVMYDSVVSNHWVVLFGARPAEVALVPGEIVPDAMLRTLKALSDPTRLRILRYLTGKPQTPSQLARRLRLRAPTVIHHLSALRLAGLVYISLEVQEEKRYTVRESAVADTFEALRKFLSVKGEE
jgi:DNA-binding transcriptional ArsR family regulator